MGYHQKAGGAWTGDILLCDCQEVEDAESHRAIYVKRIPFTQTFIPKQKDDSSTTFHFPLADGELKQPGSAPKGFKKSREKTQIRGGIREKRSKTKLKMMVTKKGTIRTHRKTDHRQKMKVQPETVCLKVSKMMKLFRANGP